MSGQGKQRNLDDMIQSGLDFVRDTGRLPTWADTDARWALPSSTTLRKYFGTRAAYWAALRAAGARPTQPAGAHDPQRQPHQEYPRCTMPEPDLEWLGGEHHLPARRPPLRFGEESTSRARVGMVCPPVVRIRRYHG